MGREPRTPGRARKEPAPIAHTDGGSSGPASVILASAGSGKTFELAGRYVGALARSGGAPEKILATTFTRKAAGEMLAKVLARLLDASRGRGDVSGLKGAEARALALSLARRIDRVRVQTLDSYFAEIGRFGAGELGLSPGWRVLDETEIEEVREEAIDAVCREVDAKALILILESMNLGGLPMRPRTDLIERAATLHDAFVDGGSSAKMWGAIGSDERAELDTKELRTLIAEFRALPPVMTGKGAEHGNFRKAREGIVAGLEQEDWTEVWGSTLVKAAMTGGTYSKLDVPVPMAAILQRLGGHARAKAVGRLAEASRAAGGLMTAFDAKLRDVKAARNALTFDDLPRMMLSLREEERRWISFRMDGKVDHLLLDEFQDTSRVQYEVLQPVLEEISATREAGRSVFAVGDLKQSLYGWRGAVPELLEGLSERLNLGAPETRAKSWRSSQGVLDAVNRVFEGIGANTELLKHQKAAERWGATFHAHKAAKEIDGFVRLEQVRLKTEEEDRVDLVIDRAVERVEEITRAHSEWSVAVITRTNGVIPRVIHRLKQREILAAQERGHPLMDEPCIGAVVSLLQLAEHPGDSASRYHVAKTALAGLLQMPSAMDGSVGMRVSRELRERIALDGIAGVVAWIRSELESRLTARGRDRLEHLERIARSFDAKPEGRIPDFIRLVQDAAVVDEASGRVSVLTVHKAKGLEWDAVVLIDLERPWLKTVPTVVVDRGEAGETDPLAPVEAVSLWPNAAQQGCDARLEGMAERWRSRAVRESISGLYVAMTRARRHLEMIIANGEEKRILLCAARVLREALGGGEPAPEDPAAGAVLYCNTYKAKSDEDQKERRESGPDAVRAAVRFAAESREVGAGLAPSKHGHSRAQGAREILREIDAHAESRIRGELWHAWFETVEWSEGWSGKDEELLRAAAGFKCDERSAREQILQFRASMGGEIGRALARARYMKRGGELRVVREWALAWNEGGLVQGRIDRVVIGLDGQRPVWAEVLDFKTDRVTSDRVKILGATYREQIQSYRRAVGRALRLEPAHVHGVLLFVQPGVVWGVD